MAPDRHMLLQALIEAEVGKLTPRNALAAEIPRLPNALEVIVAEGQRWEKAALARTSA